MLEQITGEIKEEVEKAMSVVENFSNYVVEDNQQLEAGNSDIKCLNIQIKIVKEAKKKIENPIKESLKATKDFFNPPIEKM